MLLGAVALLVGACAKSDCENACEAWNGCSDAIVQDCGDDCDESRARAEDKGCEVEWADYYACEGPDACHAPCDAQFQALSDCMLRA